MEKDKKIQLLLDMQEHPELFSEQALQSMLDDPEVRELMEATALLKQAMISEEVTVKPYFSLLTSHFSLNKKVAASIIGVLMASGIAFAAIHIARQMQNPTESMVVADTMAVANTSLIAHHSSLPEDTIPSKIVRYNEATLEQILTDMASYYGLTLRWKNEEAKTLRLFYIWNTQQSAAETVSSMNSFERIRLELNDSILTADVQTSSPKQ